MEGNRVALYLMASYLYYYRPDLPPLMSDAEFDSLCVGLLRDWDSIEHVHKYLLDKDSLAVGTGYGIREYPSIVKNAAVLAVGGS